jgi:hypothetical protein
MAALRDPQADPALIAALGASEPATQELVCKAVVLRGATNALPALRELAAKNQGAASREAQSAAARLTASPTEAVSPARVRRDRAGKAAPASPALKPAVRNGKPLVNLALGGKASSPDGVEKDGQAGGDQAAIDGDPRTYWDETDNQPLYRLRVELKQRAKVGGLRIMGWQHHRFAPKDFEVLCDDRVVKTVQNAVYRENWLTVEIPPQECAVVELKITAAHGPSPAIRELELYEQTPE